VRNISGSVNPYLWAARASLGHCSGNLDALADSRLSVSPTEANFLLRAVVSS
jgi:hypothetical protein